MTDTARDALQSALGSGFTLTRELGGGGMSRVFLARDEQLGRDVVVKLVSSDLAQDLSAERFTREVRLAANLQHAHIVPLLSAGATADGRPYYLMPFVEGESLRARLERPASAHGLPIDDVVSAVRDVSRALAYAHARGIVHRDIKPDNVLVSGGAAMVADFGIAKAMGSARETSAQPSATLTRVGTSIGSPTYMSPEQASGDPATDHRTDIYALGVTAYELLTGGPPFAQTGAHELLLAHFTETPVDVRTRRADTPEPLASIVMACLAKNPEDRPQTAEGIVSALNAASGSYTAPIRSQVATNTGSAGDRSRSRRLRPAAIAAGVAVLAVAAWAGLRYVRKPAGIDADLIAVMPFSVRDSGLRDWREGLVDVLSRSLDGAGPLRTVAASTSISKSPDRTDAVAAVSLGRAVGAGLVLFGDLTSAGPDSVRLRYSLYDVATERTRTSFDLTGARSRMDALADSMALRVLREIGSGGNVANASIRGVGTRSISAMRAFLQGQRFYRRGVVDSSRAAYQQAIEADSTFALAWRGVASVYIREGRENDPEAVRALETAIRFKSGRSPRDSMLLTADSLRLAFRRREPGRTDALDDIPSLARLFSTLQQATTAYPSDAELWMELGDAAFHLGALASLPADASRDWFTRGLQVDSTYIVPYYHLLTLAERDGDTGAMSRYLTRIATILGSGEAARYFGLLSRVTAAPRLSSELRAVLDTLSPRFAGGIVQSLAQVPDSTAIAMQVVDALAARLTGGALPLPDTTGVRDAIAFAYAARGRLRESRSASAVPALLPQLARLGAVPPDSVLAPARRALDFDARQAFGAARLLSEARDTATLRRLSAASDSLDRAAAARGQSAVASPTLVLRGYEILARGDSAAALAAFLAIPMRVCGDVPCAASTVASLLRSRGRDRDAARILDRWLPGVTRRADVPLDWMLRAELAERAGDTALARNLYRRVAAMWAAGEASTKRVADQAAASVSRLGTGQR